MSFSICWDERLKRTLSVCLSVPTWEREAVFKAKRIGDQMHGRNTTRDEEVDIGRGHEAQRLYRQQLMYYIISRAFIGIPSLIVSYGFPQYLTGFPLFLEKVLSFAEPDHHAIAKVREDIPFFCDSWPNPCVSPLRPLP